MSLDPPPDDRQTGDRFDAFEIGVKSRGSSRWKWYVRTSAGKVVLDGLEWTRAGAQYKAQRALFLLLCTAPLRRSRHQKSPSDLSCPDLLSRAAILVAQVHRRRIESRAAIERLRASGSALWATAEQLRAAQAALAATAATTRLLLKSAPGDHSPD